VLFGGSIVQPAARTSPSRNFGTTIGSATSQMMAILRARSWMMVALLDPMSSSVAWSLGFVP